MMMLTACAGTPHGSRAPTSPTSDPGPDITSAPGTSGSPPPVRAPVTIAFAGDVHFASFLADRLDDPATAMGPMADVLAKADLSIVNLETAVTTGGVAEPKQYVFRAPPSAFDALRDGGVDVVTMANNHALDYGPTSVPDALDAARSAGLPVIGLGLDAQQAYRPWIVTIHGQRIAFLAATAVLDADLVSTWSATADQPGVATALDGNNAALVAAVRQVRPQVDTVVVDLHYGSDLQTCPTDIQRQLADDLVAAGADVVVGQHAHVLLGGGYDGSAYVDYGLGNFQFYVSDDSPQAETGVLVLSVDGRRVTAPRWVPGHIRSGLPVALTGGDAAEAQSAWQGLRACAGLTAAPTTAAPTIAAPTTAAP
jgi:poly-gamma-glutamate capsule biosynthesis protein CapA/YwtB (metallophosphatase superfamily)